MAIFREGAYLVCMRCGREIVITNAGYSMTDIWCCIPTNPMVTKATAAQSTREAEKEAPMKAAKKKAPARKAAKKKVVKTAAKKKVIKKKAPAKKAAKKKVARKKK
ncbi:MAG: hypothetical protein V1789_03040 [PVC group bacterium]